MTPTIRTQVRKLNDLNAYLLIATHVYKIIQMWCWHVDQSRWRPVKFFRIFPRSVLVPQICSGIWSDVHAYKQGRQRGVDGHRVNETSEPPSNLYILIYIYYYYHYYDYYYYLLLLLLWLLFLYYYYIIIITINIKYIYIYIFVQAKSLVKQFRRPNMSHYFPRCSLAFPTCSLICPMMFQ